MLITHVVSEVQNVTGINKDKDFNILLIVTVLFRIMFYINFTLKRLVKTLMFTLQ